MKFYLIVFPLFLLLLIAHTARSSKDTDANGNETTTDRPSNNNNSTNSLSNKSTEKSLSYPKKVTSLKKRPTKTPTSFVTVAAGKAKTKKVADVTTAFKDLPADDLEFIKDLDKQFKLHGDKIRIKVEHDNSTDTKNSKRTIEGELGYGHYHNGYEYQRPKYIFYPYSQHDISPHAPGYYTPEPSVSIEPSYSYELKPQTYVEHQEEQQRPPQIDLPHNDGGAHADVGAHAPQPHYEEPVIVLRIPGPTKYASHLQTLLQKYLEIRAAQYLRILENHELHKQPELEEHGAPLQAEYQPQQQQQHQHHQQQHYEQQLLDLQPPAAGHEQHAPAPSPAEEQHYPQEVIYAHQIAPTPQPVQYPEIDEVYHGYKGRHQSQQQPQPQQHFYIPPAQEHEAPQQHVEQPHAEVPALYYLPQQQYAHSPPDHNYQNVYFVAMAPQVIYDQPEQPQQQQQQHHEQQHLLHQSEQPLQQQPIYVQEEEGAAAVADHHQHPHDHSLQLNENSPRKTHTKVIFTHNSDQGAADYSNMYPLPSIRPFERHAPTPAPAYQPHQHYHQQHQQQPQQQHQQHQHQQAQLYGPPEEHAGNNLHYDSHPLPEAESQHQDTVAITQRPFNYHAHALKAAARRGNRKRGAAPSASVAADQTDKHFDKIRDYVRDKLGAKMSSTVEFKTTEVVKG